MGKSKTLSTFAFLIIAVFAVSGTATATPADGTYTGFTDQEEWISLTVTDGSITAYSVDWICATSSGQYSVETSCEISNDNFACGSSSCPSEVYATAVRIIGTFDEVGSVSGSFDLSYRPRATGSCCVLNDMPYSAQGASSPTLSISNVSVDEGNSGSKTVEFLVTLNPTADEEVTVDWATSDGTADSSDYDQGSGTLTFTAGESDETISVVIYGDTEEEEDEYFEVELGNASNAEISDGQARCTIVDDDSTSTPEFDIIVPAAARGDGSGGSVWLTRLYIRNTGSSMATVTIYWLERGSTNDNPSSSNLSIPSGDTAVLDDVILDYFGISGGGGAIGIVGSQPLVASAAILNTAGGSEFGQGFEGIPVSHAITAGNSSSTVGLKHNDNFRTNVYIIDATGSGSSATVNILDTSGNVIVSKDYDLDAYMPRLDSLDSFGSTVLDDGAMEIVVTSGSVIGGASRVNSSSGDPITLKVPGIVTNR